MTDTGPTKRYANLEPYKWRKGESGNPKGRAPRKRFIEELADCLQERLDPADANSPTKMRAVAMKLVELCVAGNTKALAIFLPHVDPQRLRNAIKAGGDVNIIEGDVNMVRQEMEQFVIGLPTMLREMGLPLSAFKPTLDAALKRFGDGTISAAAHVAMLENVKFDTPYRMPPDISGDGGDGDP